MITVREFVPEDTDKIAELERICFSRPWSGKEICSTALSEHAVYLTALIDGEIAGYAGAYAVADTAEINNIAVFPKFRRSGVASALIDGLIKVCKERGVSKLSLDVRISNNAALKLYEKHGFYRVGSRRGYYAAPVEDAVLLDKDI